MTKTPPVRRSRHTGGVLVCSILFDVDAGGGEGEVHAVCLHHVHDVQVQIILLLQEGGIDVGGQVGRDEDVDAGIAKAGQPDDVGALVGVRAVVQHGLQVSHQLFQLGTGGAVGDTQCELIGPHGAQGCVLDSGGADLAVGDNDHAVVHGADAGGAEVDIDDLALHIAHGDPVADGKGFVQQDDDAAEQVAGAFLRGQRDGQAHKTGTGYDAADGEADDLRAGGSAQNDDQHLVGGVQQGAQGLVAPDLRAEGGQQQVGYLRSVVQALTEQESRCDLIGREQKLCQARNGPRQAGQGQIQAAVKGHPLQRAL